MKKVLLSLTLAFVLAFSCVPVGYAAVGGDEAIQPYATSSIITAVDRYNRTSGYAGIDVNFATDVDSYTITVYLQKLSNNNWVNDTSNEDYVKQVSGTNTDHRLFGITYDDLQEGSYRVKVVSKTQVGSTKYTASGYSQTF